ncbi:hypothetical protein GUJ93_ZPchr0003g17133 [Zizania palustris]|uniref:Uncharacterized protein n=1 Tax=Zizania palustris TaxID=103762 RepID=A0A8J5VX40_ZIZPA|nr:hypothetical protein GUJ93_ZPchr0003g17133 [Zizania palustris]
MNCTEQSEVSSFVMAILQKGLEIAILYRYLSTVTSISTPLLSHLLSGSLRSASAEARPAFSPASPLARPAGEQARRRSVDDLIYFPIPALAFSLGAAASSSSRAR